MNETNRKINNQRNFHWLKVDSGWCNRCFFALTFGIDFSVYQLLRTSDWFQFFGRGMVATGYLHVRDKKVRARRKERTRPKEKTFKLNENCNRRISINSFALCTTADINRPFFFYIQSQSSAIHVLNDIRLYICKYIDAHSQWAKEWEWARKAAKIHKHINTQTRFDMNVKFVTLTFPYQIQSQIY